MAPRVVHLSDEHHAKLKSYAAKLDESMTKIVERWIDSLGKPVAVIVQKRPYLPPLNMVDDRTLEQKIEDGDAPAQSLPPFWANPGVKHGPPTE